MHYKLIVTDEMNSRLNDCIDYLVNNIKNVQAAQNFLSGVVKIYDHLEINPRIYRESEDPFMAAFHYREAKLNGMDYIIIYKIVDYTVFIMGIFHCLENYVDKIKPGLF